VQAKKSTLTTLSNEALCKLRDEISALLKSRAEELQRELNRLTGGQIVIGRESHRNGAPQQIRAKRRKVAPKYRGPDGETWTGRGLKPRWLTTAINKGKRPEDFLIGKEQENTPSI
jgi:DNA-binding protein H-NS